MKKRLIRILALTAIFTPLALWVASESAKPPKQIVKKTIVIPKRPTTLPLELGYGHIISSVAMVNKEGKRYCSAVNALYKDRFYTLSAAHCCNATREGVFLKEIRIENSENIRNILRVNVKQDICVMDNKDMFGVRVAKESPKRGDKVTNIGYPLGGEQRISVGKIRHYKKSFDFDCTVMHFMTKTCKKHSTLRSSVKIAPGSSGSPLFNSKGEVCSIISTTHRINDNRRDAGSSTLNKIRYQLELVYADGK